MGRWVPYNPNPQGKAVGDCAIRALCKALGMDWESVYTALTIEGFHRCDLLSANHVWGNYLYRNGFVRDLISDDCEACYTVEDFAREHPKGTYVLAISGHVVCVWDGDYYDSWDSGAEEPIYYWHKPEEE